MSDPSTLPPKPTPSVRFGGVIDWLLILVAHRRPVLGDQMVHAIWWRLRRLQRRFDAVVARVLAGKAARFHKPRVGAATPPAAPPVFPDPVLPNPALPDPALPDPGVRLPTGHAWLHRLLGEHVPARAAAVRDLFSLDPEMRALIASDPGFGRVLRPLFDMLGMKPPPCLPPPRKFTRSSRRRTAEPRAAKPPRPIKPVTVKAGTVKPVTGRALAKYLPWKGPRPWGKPRARVASVAAPAASIAAGTPKTST